MASEEQLKKALVNADKAGDTEAAKKLASKLKSIRQPKQERSSVDEFGRQFAGGAADVASTVAGLPADVINYAASFTAPEGSDARIPLGSQDIRGFMTEHADVLPGVSQGDLPASGEEPETLAGQSGRLAGMAAGSLPFMAGGLSQVSRGRPGQIGRNIAADLGEEMARKPTRFAGVETGLGATAGTGGYYAEQAFPESDSAKLVGEVLGGVAPIGVVSGGGAAIRKAASVLPGVRAVVGVGKRLGKKVGESITPRGAGKRASGRVDRATEDREAALKEMQNADTLEGLTPAQQTGDQGLLELEKSVMQSSDALRRQSDEQIANMDQVIRESMKELGGDVSPEATRETFEAAQNHLRNLLDTRVRIAAQNADERLERLGPKTPREEANRIAREEIEKAMKDVRAQERELYNRIPEDTEVPFLNSQQTFENIRNSLSKAQQEDIPSVAKKFLSPDSEDYLGKFSDKPGVTKIREVRGIQSKLREDARIARSNGQYNRARISDEIADSITDDIANANNPEVSDMVQTAVGFSRDKNQRFTQGTVGKILGRARTGEESIPTGMTLESTLGIKGPKSRESYDDILKAADTPELKGAFDDYLKSRFISEATRNGQVNPQSARTFIRQYDELLNRMPDLRQEIQGAVEAGNVSALRQRQADTIGARLNKPNVSKATMFIQKEPDKAFSSVLQSRKPATEMGNLVNMAGRDQSGEATKGLKSAFTDYVMRQSGGDQISGQKLENLLNDDKFMKAAQKLYTKDEMSRLKTIANTAAKLDKAKAARESQEGIIGDAPGMVSSTLVRILGARYGAPLVPGAGGLQSAQIMSKRFKDLIDSGVRDPASRLLIDAVQDEKLFREVLSKRIGDKMELSKPATRRLNAWAASVLAESGAFNPMEQLRQINESDDTSPSASAESGGSGRSEQLDAP